MADFHEVKLELVRPGPSHNQLLSPLTPYLALCGEGSPVTLHIDLEHRQLLNRLRRLRYVVPADRNGNPAQAIPDPLREAEIGDLGEKVGEILSKIKTLNAELARAQGSSSNPPDSDQQLIHLRLVLSGSELAIIPFEMAITPAAFPGEGLEFCLQTRLPVVVTREVRQGSSPQAPSLKHLPEPRILFVSAAPEGLSVPTEEHLLALRSALEPWIRCPALDGVSNSADAEHRRLPYVKDRLRLLTNASIEDIYSICAQESFTHVHILAHGDVGEEAGEKRFGLALCKHDERQRKQLISGKRLAIALQAEQADGSRRSHPFWVTLATCDSGNPGSVLAPGGSIAHDLHTAGIPWVVASQLPLTKLGSVLLTEALYPRLLRGDDPRSALFEMRRQLARSARHDHDWASLAVYATLSEDFPEQVVLFFERQTRRAIEISLDQADSNSAQHSDSAQGGEVDLAQHAEVDQAIKKAEGYLAMWRKRLPEGDSTSDRLRRMECYGVHGSTFKRSALLLNRQDQPEESRKLLEKAARYYERAMNEAAVAGSKYHWVATQAFSLHAALENEPDHDLHRLARFIARLQLGNNDPSEQAWAHATLAELEMLSILFHETPDDPSLEQAALQSRIVTHCQDILKLMGPTSFHVASTRRQFERYLKHWKRDSWRDFAEAAVKTLKSEERGELPRYS